MRNGSTIALIYAFHVAILMSGCGEARRETNDGDGDIEVVATTT